MQNREDRPEASAGPGLVEMRLPRHFTLLSLVGLGLGVALGILAHHTGSRSLLLLSSVVEPFGRLWTDALRMMVIPLVISFVFVAVTSFDDVGKTGRLGGKALLSHLGLMAVGAALALGVTLPFLGYFTLDPSTVEAFRQSAAGAPELEAGPGTGLEGPGDWLRHIIPENPIRAAADNELLPLIVFTVFFALAVTQISTPRRDALTSFFRGVADASLIGVGWLLWLLPVAVFGLTLPLAARAGGGAVAALGTYIVLVCALLITLTAFLYPVAVFGGRISPGRFARGMAPAQAVAAASRSSLATLPALLESADSKLGMPRSVAGFVLPLSASTFRLNRTVSSPTKLLFVAYMYGVSVDPAFLAVYVGSVFLLSFTSPGIPSGGFGLTLPFYIAAGIPVEGYVLMRTIDAVPDIFKTVLNVTGDMTVTALVARPEARPGR